MSELDKIKFEREALYQQVWKTPISRLSNEFGLSDVGLAKICRKLNVPRPPLGYWAKRQFGKQPKVPSLPPLKPGEPATHVHYHYSQDDSRINIKQAFQDVVLPQIKVEVPDSLIEPLRFVKEINNNLKVQSSDPIGLLSYRSRGIWVKVSPESKDRAIRILDALIRGFESAGYGFKKKKDDYREYFVLEVDREYIEFSLSERTHQKDHVLTSEERYQKKIGKLWSVKKYDYLPTGELSLNLTNKIYLPIRKSWNDCKGKRIENQLSEFINGAVLAAHAIKIDRKKAEEEKIRREEEHRRWQENEWRKTQEKTKVDRLISEANQWNVSEIVRRYVQAIENRLSTMQIEAKILSELNGWLSWAKEKAAELDPLNKIIPRYKTKNIEEIDNIEDAE